jgi:hypothetical protein
MNWSYRRKSGNPAKDAYLHDYAYARYMIKHYPEFTTWRIKGIIHQRVGLCKRWPNYVTGKAVLNAWRSALPLATINDKK